MLYWTCLLDRNDVQMGMQELLAAVLALSTFSTLLSNAYVQVYAGNAGVMDSLIHDSCKAAEANMRSMAISGWLVQGRRLQ